MATKSTSQVESPEGLDDTLLTIQSRVLWLAMNMVHYANNVRANPDDGQYPRPVHTW